MITGEVEGRAVALAVGVFDAGDEVRGGVDGYADCADHGFAVARIERRHDRTVAGLLFDDEVFVEESPSEAVAEREPEPQEDGVWRTDWSLVSR